MNLISNSVLYTVYLFFWNSCEDLLKKKTLQKKYIQSENRFLQLVTSDTNVNFILKILKNGMLLI